MNLHSPALKIDAKNVLMEFLSLHKWTVMQLASVLLTVPVLGEMPTGVAGLGLLSFLFASWRQWKAEKRRQELHDAKMEIFRAHMLAGRLDEAGEVLG